MLDDMEEIIAEFITEAEESLDKIDPLFVELEAKGHDKDILNEIFRSMHTIKGAAGFLGFQSIVDVAHGAEHILKKLREGEISLTKQLTDVILKCVDMLRLLFRHLKLKDGKEEDTKPLLDELDRALKNTQSFHQEPEIPLTDKESNEKAISFPPPPSPENPPADSPAYASGTEGQGGIAGQVSSSEKQSAVQVDSGKERVIPDKKEFSQTIRVDISRIDKVMDLAGEVVLVRNRLLNIVNYIEARYSDDPYMESLFETVSFLDLVTSDTQVAVMKMRMQPINKVFSKFPRLVRDISSNLGKEVNLTIYGEGTEVDKSVIEHIGDPLVHIIRNAVDHGIESVEERLSKGKPHHGTIEISAYQKGNHIVIEVSDNGKGIDVERVKRKAMEKALITEDEAARMSENEALNLLFLPGFSTVEVATELSGRGVGMDVVKTSISKLNGHVEVITKKDTGTTFRINIPLTLAIIHVLMVRSGVSYYAIPLTLIEETLKVSKKEIANVVGQKVINIRGRVLPIFELSDILGNGRHIDFDQRYVVVISVGDTKFCLALDELLGQEEIFIKTIKGIDTDSSFVLGATITGDGKVVLVLDIAGISRNKVGLKKT